MNKLTLSTLEGRIYCFDTRTFHHELGYSSVNIKINNSTIWQIKHSKHNRDIFMAMCGDGALRIYEYKYPS